MNQLQTDYINRNNASQDQYTPGFVANQQKPATIQRRIGSTTYTVAVHFSQTSKETMNDKILRLVRDDEEAVG